MGEYRAPFIGRGAFAALFSVSWVWTMVVLATALEGGLAGVAHAAFSVVTFVWNAYWCLYRIAFRLSIRAGELEWEAPLCTETVRLADVASIRYVPLLPNLLALRRYDGRSLLLMSGKGLPACVAGMVRQRPGVVHSLGPWTRLAERLPGPTWWRPHRPRLGDGDADP
jgi:hypothetical protein